MAGGFISLAGLGGLSPAVAAYAAEIGQGATAEIRRLNTFIKTADEVGGLHEALFLGAGLNTADASPITFFDHQAPDTPISGGIYDQTLHGFNIDTSGGTPLKFPLSSNVSDCTVVFLGGTNEGLPTGTNTMAGLRYLRDNGDYGYAYYQSTDTSGTYRPRHGRTGASDQNGGIVTPLDGVSGDECSSVRAFTLRASDGQMLYSLNGAAFAVNKASGTSNPISTGTGTQSIWLGGFANHYQAVLIFDKILSDAEIAALSESAFSSVLGSNINLVVEGDSIPSLNSTGSPYWHRVAARISGPWQGAVRAFDNIATSGHTAKAIYDQAVAGSLDGYAAAGDGDPWLLIQVGVNDLMSNAASGDYTNTKILEHITETCRMAKEAGFAKTIVCTITKYGTPPASRNTDREAINVILRAGSAAGAGYIDHVLDMDQHFVDLGGVNYNSATTTWMSDTIHPTHTGKIEMGNALNEQIPTPRS